MKRKLFYFLQCFSIAFWEAHKSFSKTFKKEWDKREIQTSITESERKYFFPKSDQERAEAGENWDSALARTF